MPDLRGQRVLVTRPRHQAPDFVARLEAAGAQAIPFPVIQIGPAPDLPALDQALSELDRYEWLVLTSVNGVEAVWERLGVLGIQRLPARIQVAAIGPKTAEALHLRGVKPAFMPEEFVAEALLPGLMPLKGRRVLLTRADIARPALVEAIRQAGGEALEIAAYQTLPAEPGSEALAALRSGVDWVTFTSSSTVRGFKSVLHVEELDLNTLPGKPRFAYIGPITAATAREEGFPPGITAVHYTTQGLLEAMQAAP